MNPFVGFLLFFSKYKSRAVPSVSSAAVAMEIALKYNGKKNAERLQFTSGLVFVQRFPPLTVSIFSGLHRVRFCAVPDRFQNRADTGGAQEERHGEVIENRIVAVLQS